MNTFTTLDILRGAVLFEIVVVFILSTAIFALYAKRSRNIKKRGIMPLHVMGAALSFTLAAVGVFWWTIDRIGDTEVHPSIYLFLTAYGVGVASQYFMYKYQVGKFRSQE